MNDQTQPAAPEQQQPTQEKPSKQVQSSNQSQKSQAKKQDQKKLKKPRDPKGKQRTEEMRSKFQQIFNPVIQITHKLGRPATEYNTEWPDMLVSTMARGLSWEAFCGSIMQSPHTMNKFLKEVPDFLHAKEVGQALSRFFWEEQGIIGIRLGKDFNAAVWIFNMINRFGWRNVTALTGSDGGAVKVEYEQMRKQLTDRLDLMGGRQIDFKPYGIPAPSIKLSDELQKVIAPGNGNGSNGHG